VLHFQYLNSQWNIFCITHNIYIYQGQWFSEIYYHNYNQSLTKSIVCILKGNFIFYYKVYKYNLNLYSFNEQTLKYTCSIHSDTCFLAFETDFLQDNL
jgi:hypothetical protein